MKKTKISIIPALLVGTLLVQGCAVFMTKVPDITGDRLAARLAGDISTLASDEFQGRRPGTPGGRKTVEYIERRFREIGLEPGNGDSYLQAVSLTRVAAEPGLTLTISSPAGSMVLEEEDFAARVTGNVPLVKFDKHEIVLVGFGIQAPEFDWDDYAGVDVAGKVVFMFRNDPGFATGDTALFNGKEDSRHGGYRRKYALALEQEPAATFLIWDANLSDSDYGWDQTRRYYGPGRTRLSTDPQPEQPEYVSGAIYVDAARRIFELIDLDYDSLVTAAATRGYQSVPLDLTLNGDFRSNLEEISTHNVMGLLRGSKRPDELVIYMGHWDHEGIDTTLEGDQIYNGAVDNASGTAAVINMAAEFVTLESPPARSILFIGLTSEELGMLGSKWYAENPIFPLTKTAAAINIDMIFPYGKTRDLVVFGLGKSQLDGYLRRAAAKQGMVLGPDLWPDENYYFRSDHINLARKGVPALSMDTGVDYVDHDREWGLAKVQAYSDSMYH
ncbi:MAG: M28 family peptidase, partial [Candidatus Neomarinimicrobiota bacterium]